MHLLITGGTGFFGKALLRYLSSIGNGCGFAGARFTLLSRDPQKFCCSYPELLNDLNIQWMKGDIEQPESLIASDYTHIIHAATDSTKGLLLTPLYRFHQIVNGTRNVLELARRCGNPKVLLTSSGGVYGPQPPDMEKIPEDYWGMPDPLNPQNAYGVGKRMAEHLAALYQDTYGLEIVIARCFAFIGRDLPLDAHFAMGNFIRDALLGQDIVIQGDGSAVRSYLDQRDLAEWLITLLLHGKAGRAYNVGSSNAISVADLAALIAQLAGGKSCVRILGRTEAGASAQRSKYVPDISRISHELGLGVRYDLVQSIQDMLAALTSGIRQSLPKDRVEIRGPIGA